MEKKWCHSNDGFLKFVYVTNVIIIVTCKEFLKSTRKGQAKRIMDRVQIDSSKTVNEQTFKLLVKKWGQYLSYWQNLEGTNISLLIGKRKLSCTVGKCIVRAYF